MHLVVIAMKLTPTLIKTLKMYTKTQLCISTIPATLEALFHPYLVVFDFYLDGYWQH